MKRTIFIILVLLIFGQLTACNRSNGAEIPNACRPLCTTALFAAQREKQRPVEADESAIGGSVRSVVPLSLRPGGDGQANFEILDAPCAVTGEGFLVLVEHAWMLFEAREITE